MKSKKTIYESGVGHRHLVAGLEYTWAGRSRFERVGSQKLKANGQIGLPLRNFPHFFDTQMHLWDQKAQKARHRDPLKKGSLSENVMKEGERVLFQPLH